MAPELPLGFVPRPGQLDPLLDALLESGRLNPTPGAAAFYGPGGFGKTTLAAAVCHDDDIITAYDAGLLWVTLGENPNVFNELVKLYAALTGQRPGFVDEQDAARALAERLAEGSYLLVIDDVWRPAHLRPFLQGGPNCARLVTTRYFDLAATLQTRVSVDEMSSDEAVAMLTARLPAAPADRRPFRRLASRLGEWPLLLELARDVLHRRMAQGATLEEALAYLETAYDRRGVTAFDRRDDDARNAAAGRSLQVSIDQLEKNEQGSYPQLAIFPADVPVPLTVLAALWGVDSFDCEDLVTRLAALSLLYYDLPHRSISLHDMIRAYLAGQLADPAALHARLLDAWSDLHALPDAYAWRWVGYHLAAAGRSERLRQLLFDYNWLQAKLNAADANALVADCARLPDAAPIRCLGQALRQAGHILAQDLGQLAGQLWGRLADDEDGAVQALLAQARAQAPRPYLRPLTASLRESSALVRTLIGHVGIVTSVTVTDDGRYIVSASRDGTLKIWDASSAKCLRTLEGHSDWVNAVAVTQDRRIISGSSDRRLKVWDLETGTLLRTLEGHTDRINGVAVTPDGGLAVSASDDRTMRVWDLSTGDSIFACVGHSYPVKSVVVTPDGTRAVSGSEDRSVKVWNLADGALLNTLEGHTNWIDGVATTPDSICAISASSDNTLKMWNLDNGTLSQTLEGHTDSVYGVTVTSDGSRAISASADNTLKVWNVAKGRVVSTLEGHAFAVFGVAVTPDGQSAISASADGTLRVWDLARAPFAQVIPSHAGWISALTVTPDSNCFISASWDRTLKVWERVTGRLLHTLQGHSAAVFGVAVTSKGTRALSAASDNTLGVWDLANGDLLHTLKGHDNWVTSVAITPDDHLAISSSSDHTMKVWDLDRYALVRTLKGHRGVVYKVALAPDGRQAVSASLDHTLRVWDLYSGDCSHILEGHTGRVNGVAVTPDGRAALSGSSDQTVRVWDLATGALVKTLKDHAGPVYDVLAVSNDGYVISTSFDGTLKVWSLAEGNCVATFYCDGPVNACAAVPNSAIVIVGGQSGRIHILSLEK